MKAGLGRADFTGQRHEVAQGAREAGFTELPVHAAEAARVVDLAPRHRDPFDRLLIAQALAGPLRFYTAGPALPAYSELVTLAA